MSNIMIVEDNISICHLLTAVLSKKHVVISANSLKEALEKRKEFSPNIIILDLNLGDGCGEDFVAEGCIPNNATVIIISAVPHPEDRASEMLGDRDYYVLKKPFQMPEILQIVEKASIHNAVNKIVDNNKLGTQVIEALREVHDRLESGSTDTQGT